MRNEASKVERHVDASFGLAERFIVEPRLERQMHHGARPRVAQFVGGHCDRRERAGRFRLEESKALCQFARNQVPERHVVDGKEGLLELEGAGGLGGATVVDGEDLDLAAEQLEEVQVSRGIPDEEALSGRLPSCRQARQPHPLWRKRVGSLALRTLRPQRARRAGPTQVRQAQQKERQAQQKAGRDEARGARSPQ